jgi:hypothetical protein
MLLLQTHPPPQGDESRAVAVRAHFVDGQHRDRRERRTGRSKALFGLR